MTPMMTPMMTPVGSLVSTAANAPLVTLISTGGEGEGAGGQGEGGGGEGGGEDGGGDTKRGPQSMQSVPRAQKAVYSEPGPPSSQVL